MKLRAMVCACAVFFAVLSAPAIRAEEPQAAHGAPAAHASESHEEAASIFAGGIGNAIVTLIIFGIVVYVLGTRAWPPLLKSINDREAMIRKSIEDARRQSEESQKLLAQYQTQLDRARTEATAIVEEGRRDAEAVRRKIQDDARKESDEMVARARREIQLATDSAIKELYDKTADLAVQVAGGIIRKELKADDHRGLVKESLDRMAQATRN